jgi:hypothetical protein
MHSFPPASRRDALKRLGLAVGAAALPLRTLRAAEPAHLSVTDPSAVAVGYVENALQVDPKKYTGYAKGQTCENCLQLQGAAGVPYRPCSLFPGKSVAVAGWCSAWTPEI